MRTKPQQTKKLLTKRLLTKRLPTKSLPSKKLPSKKLLVAMALASLGLASLLASFSPLSAQSENTQAGSAPGRAAIIELNTSIDSVVANFLERGIGDATNDGAQFLIILLDTPGGSLDATRDIVREIFESEIPVVVFVSPAGARAASAGTFVAAAAHVAAMSPATSIGAASPVRFDGRDLDTTLKAKVTEDAVAFIQSIAEERNSLAGRQVRNSDALAETVRDASAFSHQGALDVGIIDLIADNTTDLLSKLDGMRITLNSGQEVVLATDGITTYEISPNFFERFVDFIASPTLAFLLLAVGGTGIIVELWNPGLFIPAIIGFIALGIAVLALVNLPANWLGLGLIILAMALFYFETQAPGFGVFGLGGAISFVFGGLLLFGDLTSGERSLPGGGTTEINLVAFIGVSAGLFACMAATFWFLREAKKAPQYVTPTALSEVVGKIGRATTDLNPGESGSVHVVDEDWSAEADQPISKGESVIVEEVDGFTVKVAKAPLHKQTARTSSTNKGDQNDSVF